MKPSEFRSKLKEIINQRNGYLLLATGSMIICIALSFICLSLVGQERTIIVPPVVDAEFWVSNSAVSPAYLAQMTDYFSAIKFNVTPENVDRQQAAILHFTDPSYYNELKTQFVQESDHIKKDHISINFWPMEHKVDAKHLTAVITGDLKITVGDASLPMQRVSYQFSYRFVSGQLKIMMLNEEKKNV